MEKLSSPPVSPSTNAASVWVLVLSCLERGEFFREGLAPLSAGYSPGKKRICAIAQMM